MGNGYSKTLFRQRSVQAAVEKPLKLAVIAQAHAQAQLKVQEHCEVQAATEKARKLAMIAQAQLKVQVRAL